MALATSMGQPARAAGPPPSVQVPETSTFRADGGAVRPVATVDLERFVGLWYEIARIPVWFQKRCAGETTALYQLREDARIKVVNRCRKRNGAFLEAVGLARVADPNTNARLRVSFVNLLGWRPFWGDYWIIGLDPDYRWLVVGDPKRRVGWILGRTPNLESSQQEAAFQTLERNGYERSRFVFTPQQQRKMAIAPFKSAQFMADCVN